MTHNEAKYIIKLININKLSYPDFLIIKQINDYIRLNQVIPLEKSKELQKIYRISQGG